MNTVDMEKIMKKELKDFDPALYNQIDEIEVYAQASKAKKPKYCVVITMKSGDSNKDKAPSVYYTFRRKDDGLKELYLNVMADFLEGHHPAMSEPKNPFPDVLKKRFKKAAKKLHKAGKA